MVRREMSRRSWTLLVIVAGVWGGSFMLTAIAIRDLAVPVVALFRTGMGALVLLPIALRSGALAGLRAQLGPVFVLGVVQLAAPFLLLGYGQRTVPSGLAGILVSSTPLWTALLAVWIDREERSHGRGLVGLAVGIVGVVLLCGLELSGSLDTLLGAALLLVGALSYALGGFLGKKRTQGMSPVGAITGAMLGASVAARPAGARDLARPRARARPARGRDRPRRDLRRSRLAPVLHRAGRGRSGEGDRRSVPRAGVRGALRHRPPRRGAHRGGDRRPGARRLRLVARGLA